ncbi:MAG: hypothetical protein KC613_25810, partial [Myxococcales bacterium]|nr:hypothetical protein [Myxococcales bacterium]
MDRLQFTLDERLVTLETGRLAPRAAGAVMARCGDAAVLAAVATAPLEGAPLDHLPLMVDYRERASAAGRIPGNYLRREVRQGEGEILTSRLIDRALRPLLKAAEPQRIHVTVTVYSHDPTVDLDDALLRAVKEVNADLVVMASHL